MPALRRKHVPTSRRRRHDGGEEEESVLGDFEDDSLSEGSEVSNGEEEADVEGSDSSGVEPEQTKDSTATTTTDVTTGKSSSGQKQIEQTPVVSLESSIRSNGDFKPSADTEAMLHGLGHLQHSQETEEIKFDELGNSAESDVLQADDATRKAPRHETPAQRSRREHQEYIRQRNANPAFVPNRGMFFLHDDRNAATHGPNPRPFIRGRGRGYGPPINVGRGMVFNEPTDRPWAHDLHEGHEMAPKPPPVQMPSAPLSSEPPKEQDPANSAAPTAPNRSFSFTTTLGNVNVQVSLPGMAQKISVANVVKKHHTLLPQHRPPLRRDKPVRVSLPGAPPRYIHPSTERSFIFIPRDMRPNRQGYGRGRGRGSFHGSRRPSIYGSVYTPSIAMSRKSSIGASTMRDSVMSPADSVMFRTGPPGLDSARPVVRMPSAVPTPSISRTGMPLVVNGQMGMNLPPQHMQAPMMYGSHSTAIPMHQPRPQKTVSVADIESPASFQFKTPQPQQEQPFHQQVQPFHQQVPTNVKNTLQGDKASQSDPQSMGGVAGATPLSQIPEGTVFAQGYQPYPFVGGSGYFGAPYNNGAVYYPPMANPAVSFRVPPTGPALAPSFVPGSQSHPVAYLPAGSSMEGGIPSNTVAHESNGMVYYYNPTMFGGVAQGGMQHFPMAATSHMVPMANGMPNQAPFYYSSVPTGVYYPGQSG